MPSHMTKHLALYLLITCGLSTSIFAQQSHLRQDRQAHDRLADWLYAEALYRSGELPTHAALEASTLAGSKHDRSALRLAAQQAIADVIAERPASIHHLQELIWDYAPHGDLTPAYMELGNYYYNTQKYQLAVTAYDEVETLSLSDIDLSEHNFKKGYCLFVLKRFDRAARLFDKSKNLRNIYYYPTNYYSGMCAYFEGDYVGAIEAFDRASSSSVYKSLTPYYISQIYFAQGEYDQLLNYGEQAIRQPSTDQVKDIRLLLGQAYYKKGQYERSLPHLEYYEANTTTLTKEEFYQIAFTQYRLGYYDKAIDNFLELTLLDAKMGQVASYYLADCYQRTGDLASARSAYRKVSQMDYDRDMQAEATFNYGKLSAEQGYDRAAINTLVAIDADSPYYMETRAIINDLLNTTDDYPKALAIIEGLTQLNSDLKATYQRLSYKQAMRSLLDQDSDAAQKHLDKVATYPVDPDLVAQSLFWKAYILHTALDYKASTQAYDLYYAAAGTNTLSLDPQTRLYSADYCQGYNYLKLLDHVTASYFFKRAVQGINKSRDRITDPTLLNQVLPDALIRAGDCSFKLGDYSEARLYYNQSIERRQAGYVYAMYQRALIEGLTGNVYDQVITLQDITEVHPDHPYADDAYMVLGDAYLALGRFLPARDAFVEVADVYGGEYKNRALLKLGLINYNQGDVETALNYYKRVFANSPSPSESQESVLAIEEIYVEDLGQTDDYFAWLETVPGLEVSSFAKDSLNYKVGLNQYEQANYNAAIDGFGRYLVKYPQGYYRHAARYYTGESHAALKQYSQALRMYDQVIGEGLNPYYVDALRKGAIIAYNHTMDYGKAYRYYEALTRQSVDADLLYEAQLGALNTAYRAADLTAVTLWNTVVKDSPLATAAARNTADYYLGKLAQAAGDYTLALAAYNQVSEATRNAEGAEARYRIGEIYHLQGRVDLAEQQCGITNDLSKGYPYWIAKNLLLLSEIYLGRQDVFNARAAAEAVAENFKDDDDIAAAAQALLLKISTVEAANNRIKSESEDGNLELNKGN